MSRVPPLATTTTPELAPLLEQAEGSELSEADLIEHARGQLAGFKRPKRIMFEALPKTTTGKIRKNLLRERVADLA